MPSEAESNLLFGPLLGPWNIERAVLKTLEEWLPSYLAEVERKNTLRKSYLGRPPAPESYRGGIDFESIEEALMPMVIVNANPTGEPERSADTYIQKFLVEVGCVIYSQEGDRPETSARHRAGLFAAATMLLVAHGGLGGLATQETVLTGAPRVEKSVSFPDNRQICVGLTAWHVYAAIINPDQGPTVVKATEPEEPYPNWPEAKTDKITVKGETTPV